MSYDPFRKVPRDEVRPQIWTSGSQRPPFDLRATARASLHLARVGVAPVLGATARLARQMAVNVKGGAGRIPAERLGHTGRFLPSHLRVAAWLANLAATLAHASATSDPDVRRGNALVVEIAPPLWTPDEPVAGPVPAPAGAVATGAIQVGGYLIGRVTGFLALPYGLIRALWLFARGEDLRKIGVEA